MDLMKIIDTHEFKHLINEIHRKSDTRKFCFILGAGASYPSGIPTGEMLAKKWYKKIIERTDKVKVEEWIIEKEIDENDLGASYGKIYQKCFENDKNSGYEFLVREMRDAKPSHGHYVIAQILSRYPEHCVITTNFDSLVETSVYQFTDKTPLVCGHQALSNFARISPNYPLIIKIHNDLRLAPKSDDKEIKKLAKGWKLPLDHLFNTHLPIIIGYGGNDGSLMRYFETLNKKRLTNFFWCGLNENFVSERVKKLIIKLDGRFVKIKGFDELMSELMWVFDEIGPIREELIKITNERIKSFNEKLGNVDTNQKEV